MSRIQKERDRLLSATARNVGLTATATALLCLSIPGTLPLPLYLASLVLLAGLGLRPVPARRRCTRCVWIVTIVVAGRRAHPLITCCPARPLEPGRPQRRRHDRGRRPSPASRSCCVTSHPADRACSSSASSSTLAALAVHAAADRLAASAKPLVFTMAGWVAHDRDGRLARRAPSPARSSASRR